MFKKNNKKNVSTTRGVKGGYAFVAPLGTAGAPTKETFETWAANVPEGWENIGYIPEDGFTEGVDLGSGDEIRDINLDTVDESDGAATETIAFGMMEIKKTPLSIQFGSANVTDEKGVLAVAHNWSKASEHNQYVFCLLLKDDRIWVKYVPDGKRTGLTDLTGNKTTVAQREATITYITDEEGNGAFDFYQSTETSADDDTDTEPDPETDPDGE